jgi:hypothetical protein
MSSGYTEFNDVDSPGAGGSSVPQTMILPPASQEDFAPITEEELGGYKETDRYLPVRFGMA